jgi:hypothetical protein
MLNRVLLLLRQCFITGSLYRDSDITAFVRVQTGIFTVLSAAVRTAV